MEERRNVLIPSPGKGESCSFVAFWSTDCLKVAYMFRGAATNGFFVLVAFLHFTIYDDSWRSIVIVETMEEDPVSAPIRVEVSVVNVLCSGGIRSTRVNGNG